MRRYFRRVIGESLVPFRHCRMILDPDPDGVGGGDGGTSAGSVEAADVSPVNGGPDRSFADLSNATVDDPPAPAPSARAVAAPPVPADPNQRAGIVNPPAQTQQPAAGDWQSIRDAASTHGYTFGPQVTDDRAVLVRLIQPTQGNRQADYYAQLGRQPAPQTPAIQQFLSQQ